MSDVPFFPSHLALSAVLAASAQPFDSSFCPVLRRSHCLNYGILEIDEVFLIGISAIILRNPDTPAV